MPTIFTPHHHRLSRLLKQLFLLLTALSWSAATLLLLVPLLPHLLYRLSPNLSQTLAQNLATTTNTPPPKLGGGQGVVSLPPFDSSLPTENSLTIPSIGVHGPIHEGNWEEALLKGIWREPQFASPNTGSPTILAAHRWGYLNWTNSFRRLNSFYNLPKLKEGDSIELIWEQRKYTYEVYKSETGQTITDYQADLILYTCQLWDSPIRVFKYAQRLN